MFFGAVLLLTVFVGVPLLIWVLDRQLATRMPRLRESPAFARSVRFLRRIAGFAYPKRLVLPVQLTLQSNTRPLVFFVGLTVGIVIIVLIGNMRATAWSSFTLSSEFEYLDTEQVRGGFRSTHYDDMASPVDRLRAWPRIDSFNQEGSFVRLFLPYQPLRDNLVLDQLCGSAEETADPVGCLRRLWSVSIDGTPVSISDFEPAERGDLNMRGLIGLVPLAGLEPGMRRLEVVWNPSASAESAPVDDRYNQATMRYVIPIAFSPGYELSLD
jgi:hypothetical protein